MKNQAPNKAKPDINTRLAIPAVALLLTTAVLWWHGREACVPVARADSMAGQ